MPATNANNSIPQIVAGQQLTADQQQLVLDNRDLAHSIASEFSPARSTAGLKMEREDRDQVADLALCEAARAFPGDRSDPLAFARYAAVWIRGRLCREYVHVRNLRRGDNAMFESSSCESVVLASEPWMRRRSEWANSARVRLRVITLGARRARSA